MLHFAGYLALLIAALLLLLFKYYQKVLFAPNQKPVTRTTGTQTQPKVVRNKAHSKPPPSPNRNTTASASGSKSEQEGYLASESSESLDSEERRTQLKRKNCNTEKLLARPRSFSDSTDSESHSSQEYRKEQPPNVPLNPLAAATVPLVTIDDELDIKHHTELCSGNENQSSSDGEYFQSCQEQSAQGHSEYVCADLTIFKHTKIQSEVMDQLKELIQASFQDMLESHLEKQRDVSEERKLLVERDQLIEKQKAENEELRKELAEKGHQIEKRDNQIKEKDRQIKKRDRQIQALREGTYQAADEQTSEERAASEKDKRNKLEKGFLFFL